MAGIFSEVGSVIGHAVGAAGGIVLNDVQKQLQKLTTAPLPPTISSQYNVYPSDLLSNPAGGKQYYMQVDFSTYTSADNFTPSQSVSAGGIILPIPRKLNEHQTVVWQEVSATAVGLTAAADSLAGIAGAEMRGLFGAIGGIALLGSGHGVGGTVAEGAEIIASKAGLQANPFLTLLFKTPGFKKFTFMWTFAPNNEQESITVANIIHAFKYNMLPSVAGGLFYHYPNLANITLYPNDFFTFKLKPCAILDVQVDYSGAGAPSFHKGTNAPSVINLTVYLEETEVWTQDNFPAGDIP